MYFIQHCTNNIPVVLLILHSDFSSLPDFIPQINRMAFW